MWGLFSYFSIGKPISPQYFGKTIEIMAQIRYLRHFVKTAKNRQNLPKTIYEAVGVATASSSFLL